MSLSFSLKKAFKPKTGIRQHIVEITLDDSYPTNGWAITAANLGLNGIHFVHVPPIKDGYGFEWDHGNSKLKAYVPAVLTSGTAGNAVTFNSDHLECTGGGTLAMSELGNTSSALDAKVLRVLAVGY